MKLFIYIILLIGLASSSYSQDTICFIKGQRVSAKVKEINRETIKYQKYSNLNGPIYTCYKNDVFYIKYENGIIDSIRIKKVIQNGDSLRIVNLVNKQLSYNDGRIFLNNVSIHNDDFLTICKYTSDHEKYNKIKLLINKVDSKQRKARGTGIASIPFFGIGGALGALGIYAAAWGNPDFLLPAIPFLATGASFAIFSKSQRKQILKLKAEAVALYNN